MLMNNVILLIDVACDEVGVGWDGVDVREQEVFLGRNP